MSNGMGNACVYCTRSLEEHRAVSCSIKVPDGYGSQLLYMCPIYISDVPNACYRSRKSVAEEIQQLQQLLEPTK